MIATWTFVKDFVTLLLALAGTVLGILNAVNAHKQKKVKLVAHAKYAYMVSHYGDVGPQMGCIEVTNLSQFPVFISEIGFEILGNSRRLAVTQPLTSDHQAFARRLESHQSLTGYFDVPESSVGVAGRCYVRTESGEWFFGNMLGEQT